MLSYYIYIIHTKDGINYIYPLKNNYKVNTCAHTDKVEKQNTKWSLKSTVCLDHDPLSPPQSDSGIFWFIALFYLIALS